MSVTFKPSVRNGTVPQLLLEFSTPPTVAEFVPILKRLESQLEDPSFIPQAPKVAHAHSFTEFPFYNNGELVAVIRKCQSCPYATRDYP